MEMEKKKLIDRISEDCNNKIMKHYLLIWSNLSPSGAIIKTFLPKDKWLMLPPAGSQLYD